MLKKYKITNDCHLISLFFFFFFVCFFLLHCSFMQTMQVSFASEKNSKNASEEKANESPIVNIVSSLLTGQASELTILEERSARIKEYFETAIPLLQSKTQEVTTEFRNIALIYHTSKTAPRELSLLEKQNQRLTFDVNALYAPFAQIQNQVTSSLEQLTLLSENLKNINHEDAKSMIAKVNTLTRAYNAYNNTLKRALPSTEKLLASMAEITLKFQAEMPSLWLDYYLANSLELFSKGTWQNELNQLSNIVNVTIFTLKSELPSTFYTWFLFALRTSLATFIMVALLFASLKVTVLLPPIFHNTWKHSLKTSIPFVTFGMALYFGSWNNGSVYQVIVDIGTFFLCYGQIAFTWQIFQMTKKEDNLPDETPLPESKIQREDTEEDEQKENESQKKALVSSPFSPILISLFVSILLLTFTPFALTLSFLWAVFLILFSIHLYKKERSLFHLPRFLMNIFFLVLIAGLFFTAMGLVRFSMLSTLLYSCFAIGIHQATTAVSFASVVNKYMPQSGISALFSGLVLSVAMPIVLLFSIFSPFSWILSFPGGEYLIKNFSSVDFNIGDVSFNAMQILSVLIVFYLIRSLIVASCNYIDNSWRGHSANAVASLSTPIKTTIIFGLWGLFGLYVLNVIGFSLTSLAVVAGGLSVGIGLGLQSFVQNIFSGFSLIFGQNIREGDLIDVAGISGRVQKVSLRATQVLTFDNAIVFVPNSEFLATSFINWTHNDSRVRCIIPLGVAYGSDLETVMSSALEIVEKKGTVLAYPAPTMLFMNFGASSLDFELRFWIRDVSDKFSIMTDVRLDIDRVFKEKNIEIPFPQADLHIKTGFIQNQD